ncbi:MAG TPA: hypothetical protein GXX50_10370 [Firmicutes bacterium]|jgi:chemotaxis protein CheX|uniref:chemotaxis protein CheX n=1 Tax=Gelria sp. Kuro-4 TaxID=2796927 RepID=UPI0019AD7B47|nr:chemotaxis protein CheX [Gelria sp. Kuro-4]BCV25656.1 chemotaxis protein CheX [Gelria sp. Kuro-4]HHV58146.1 hypothetical protein [Bacillota bacterium]
MEAKFINPILTACDEVVHQLLKLDGQRGRVHIRKVPFLPEEVLVLFDVTGDFCCQVVLSLEDRWGLEIASQLLGTTSVLFLTDLARSALGELGNMIMGRALTILAEEGIQASLTVPTVLTGREFNRAADRQDDRPLLVIPFEFGRGRIEINVAACA